MGRPSFKLNPTPAAAALPPAKSRRPPAFAPARVAAATPYLASPRRAAPGPAGPGNARPRLAAPRPAEPRRAVPRPALPRPAGPRPAPPGDDQLLSGDRELREHAAERVWPDPGTELPH